MNFHYDQKITFKLDGSWYGTGLVKVINGHSLEVELLTPCKEFPKGSLIIIDKSEFVPYYDPVEFFD